MRIAFLGTPEFAVPSLERLVDTGYDVSAVVTQPDRPKGRGKKLAPPPVKEAAARFGLTVHQPATIRTTEAEQLFRGFNAEAMAVVAYGKIIPQNIIDIPPLGIINVHSSLLPKYRGAAPIQWAIAEGETRTGVTTMRIDAGLDTGEVLLAKETPIGAEETAIELTERLALMGADLLVQTLRGLKEGAIRPIQQDHEQATFAPMLNKEAGRIEWRWEAARIHNRVRGFQPWPGAWTRFRGELLHIWRSRLTGSKRAGEPGTITVDHRRLLVACGDGGLELIEVQQPGRNRIEAAAFVNGQHPLTGERLGEES